jgi:hypothetical protein
MKKEPDISIWENSTDLRAVVEVKTVLDKPQWADVKEQRNAYLGRKPVPDFRLVALRCAGLSEPIKDEIRQEPWACVLWDKGGPGAALRESEISIWKPIEDALDAEVDYLRTGN